jgi:hypothetical protein
MDLHATAFNDPLQYFFLPYTRQNSKGSFRYPQFHTDTLLVLEAGVPVVGTEIIGYGLNSRANVVQFPTGTYFFMSAPKRPHRLWDPADLLTRIIPRDCPLGIKWPQRETDHSPHVMPKLAWDDTSNSSHAFTTCTGTLHFHCIRTFFLCQLP